MSEEKKHYTPNPLREFVDKSGRSIYRISKDTDLAYSMVHKLVNSDDPLIIGRMSLRSLLAIFHYSKVDLIKWYVSNL